MNTKEKKELLSISDMENLAADARVKEIQICENISRLTAENGVLAYKKAAAIAQNDFFSADELHEQMKTNKKTIYELEETEISFDRDLIKSSWAAYMDENNAALQEKIDRYMELKQQCAVLFLEIIKNEQSANYAHFVATKLYDPNVWKNNMQYLATSSPLAMPAGLPAKEARLFNEKSISAPADAIAFAADNMIPSDPATLKQIDLVLRRIPVKTLTPEI